MIRLPRECGHCGHYDRMHYDSAFPEQRTCGYYGCGCPGFEPTLQDLTFPPNESLSPRPAEQIGLFEAA